MTMQAALVAVIVVACAVHGAWTLMPAAARNWIRRVVLHRPAQAAGGCGACSGCATSTPRPRTALQGQIVRVMRVAPRDGGPPT